MDQAEADGPVDMIKAYGDGGLSERLDGRYDEIEKPVGEFLYCS